MADTHQPDPDGTGPRPADEEQLVAEIYRLAAIRRRNSVIHPAGCTCDACRVRRWRRAS